MRFRDIAIARKLVITMTLISGVVLLLSSAGFLTYAAASSRRWMIAELSSLARVVSANSAASLVFRDRDAAAETLAALGAEQSVSSAALYTADGEVFSQYHRDKERADRIPPMGVSGHHFQGDRLVFYQPVRIDDRRVGTVFVASDMGRLPIRLKQYGLISLVILALSLGLAMFLSLLLQRAFSHPILRVADTATRIAENRDYSFRVPDDGRRDEIGAMVQAFNEMLDDIEQSDQALQNARINLEKRVVERTGALVSEIKERRKIEEHLRHEQERTQRYLDIAGVMLIALNTEGRIMLVNRKGCEVTGYDEQELLGRNWFDLMVPERLVEKARVNFERLMSVGADAISSHEEVIVTKGGKERLIAWHNTVLTDPAGPVAGTFSSGEDVSERKRLEEEMLRTQKLESVGTFAGGIAHDFNNFLMVIRGNVELAKLAVPEDNTSSRLLWEAEAAAVRAQKLTRQLITFSKGGEPVRKTVNIEKPTREAAMFVLTGANVVAEFDIPKDLWMVKVDPGQVEQAVSNLVINARHAMPEGGKVYLSLRNVEAAEAERRGSLAVPHVELRVRDEGVGIPEHIRSRIFDPYFTTKQEGSGLGLAMVHSIVRRHGGRISVDSTVGEGTTFSVLLPVSLETETEEEEETRATPLLADEYDVLVMDDDKTIGALLIAMLQKIGCCGTVVEDGTKAIAAYEERKKKNGSAFDVVILDAVIPNGMGGKETAQRLLEIDPDVRMIVSSGYSDDPLMAKHGTYGFCASLPKPYSQADLAQSLRRAIEG